MPYSGFESEPSRERPGRNAGGRYRFRIERSKIDCNGSIILRSGDCAAKGGAVPYFNADRPKPIGRAQSEDRESVEDDERSKRPQTSFTTENIEKLSVRKNRLQTTAK
ncbi:hypothetical protein TNCV_1539661 [Trichonephila clavipes]|nr:hypothetical protein TNCV_1539661 [Trichonephila clavipes]